MTLVTLQDLENSLKLNQLLKSQQQQQNATNASSNANNNDLAQHQHLNFMLQNAQVTKANLFTSAMMMQHLQQHNKSLILNCLHNNNSSTATSNSSRTPSECGGQQGSQKGQVNSGRYKTELCRQFIENGGCKYGDKCQFAHGSPDLKDVNRHPKYKTDYCRTFHSKGFCPYGPRCHFIHEFNDKFSEAMERKKPEKCQDNSNLQLEALQTRMQTNLHLNQLDELNSSFLSSSSPPISPMPQPRTRSGTSSTSSLNSSLNSSSNSSYDLSIQSTLSDRAFSPLPSAKTAHQSSLMRQSSTFNLPISKNLIQIGRSLITEKLSNSSNDQAALNQQIINIERLNELLNSNQLNFCQNGRQQSTW